MNWLAFGFGLVGSLFQSLAMETMPVQAESESVKPSPILADETVPPTLAEQLGQAEPGLELDSMGQVQSVAALSDIRPTDWAFQALQALVERYGVMAGYPNRLFRGNRPLTRYEFSAVLHQITARFEDLIFSGSVDKLQEDYAILRRLQTSYGEIADDLGDRIDALEAKIGLAERQQFSTTTQLRGQAVGVLTDGGRAKMTVVSRVRLNLNTSFSGQDLLLTQLEAGNNGGDAVSRSQNSRQNLLGTTGLLAAGGGLDYGEVDSTVRLSQLYYTFQPRANLSLTVGARLSPRDFIDFNRFANSTDKNFASSFFMNNPLIVQNQIDRPGGAGAVISWQASPALKLKALYVAADAERPNPGLTDGGLWGDRYQGSLEAEYTLNKDFVTRLQFTRAVINGLDIYAGGVNVEWAWNQQFSLFGRYGIGNYRGFNPLIGRDLDLTPQTWAIGSIIRNIVIPDSTAGLAIGQPFVASALGNRSQTNIEGFYSFLLNDNISFTPGFMIVTSPNNNRSSGTIWQFFVRMVFSF